MSIELHTLVRELFPRAGAELVKLYDGAIDNAGLLPADFLSLHDLVTLSGYTEDESLQALLLALFLALAEGSLCVEASPAGLARRLADVAAEPQSWADRIVTTLREQTFPKLIGPTESNLPVLLFAANDRQYLYFHKFLRSELSFRAELDRRLATAHPARADWQPIVRKVLHERPLKTGDQPLKLDGDQLLALGLALSHNFVIVSGGPGTGKTSLVLTLLRCLVRGNVMPEQIALAAPTGRAAQRLVDAVRTGLERIAPAPTAEDLLLHQLQARTMHQLLDYQPTRGIFRRHAENPVPADVVIIDEVSMVSVVLMAQLLQALKPDTKLILLGDKDQLPSVDAGAVLASLVPPTPPNRFADKTWGTLRKLFPDMKLAETIGDWPDHLVVLRVNHRSQPQIREVAAAINHQDVELVGRLPPLPTDEGDPDWWTQISDRAGVWFAATDSERPDNLRQLLQQWARSHFLGEYPDLLQACDLSPGHEADAEPLLQKLFARLESSRILTLVREGPWGCVGINRYLDQFLRPTLDRHARGPLFAGALVLVTTNDHARALFNGDAGLIVPSEGSLRAVFRRQAGFASYAVESLPAHEPGFALTVHKSQGSEYDNVLLVLPPTGGRRLLSKEILYTAVTRARKLAVISGSPEVLALAIQRRILRESAFSPH